MLMTSNPYLSVAEACDRLRIGRTKFYALVKTGLVPVRKLGDRTIVRTVDLDRFVDDLPQV
jgi:excisionase family DNA binding protein